MRMVTRGSHHNALCRKQIFGVNTHERETRVTRINGVSRERGIYVCSHIRKLIIHWRTVNVDDKVVVLYKTRVYYIRGHPTHASNMQLMHTPHMTQRYLGTRAAEILFELQSSTYILYKPIVPERCSYLLN